MWPMMGYMMAGSAPHNPVVVTPPPPIVPTGPLVLDFKIDSTSGSDQTNIPFTVGQIFAAGDFGPTEGLAGKLANGTLIPLQANIKATHDDGSVRHAILSGVIPLSLAGSSQTVTIVKTASNNVASALAPSSLVTAGLTGSVVLTIGGVAYHVVLQTMLSGTYTTWLSGPIANEWMVNAPFTKVSDGTAHPHLTAHITARSYAGLSSTRIDIAIESGWTFVANPQIFTYDCVMTIAGSTVYSFTALAHQHHSRWRKTFWWGTAPAVHIRHNTAYLINTKAVPNYDQSIAWTAPHIAGQLVNYAGTRIDPMGPGMAQPQMGTTGGRPDIGILPGWAVTYLLTQDVNAKIATLGNADLAGSWAAHYRDETTGKPVRVQDWPYITISDPNLGDSNNPSTGLNEHVAFTVTGNDNPNLALDSSHMPAFSYLPYIVTGDYYYLEEMQFYTSWLLANMNPYYRGYALGLVHQNQVRGQGWQLRDIAQTAYITPDSDSQKAYLKAILSNNLDWFNANYTNNPISDNTLGFITEHGIEYNNNTGASPWMDDFFTSAVGHVVELGFGAKASPLLAWKIKFAINRLTDTSFCWIVASAYTLTVRDTQTSPIYTTMGQVYQASYPAAQTLLACGSAAMATYLGLTPGEMVGYSLMSDGFPSNLQPAVAYAADVGGALGASAWATFAGRSVKPDYSLGPQFAIIPIAASANARVYIAGQSNAVGHGPRSDLLLSPLSADAGLVTFDSGTFSRVFIWSLASSTYVNLKMGVNNYGLDANSFGPEFGLAVRWMRETTGGNLYIDKWAEGGEAIIYFQSPASGGGAGSYYVPSVAYKTRQDAWLAANGITATHAGWLWVQGESDASSTQAYYQAQLTTMINDRISAGLTTSTEVRVLAQMGVSSQTYGAGVAAAKVAYQAANPTTTKLITMANHMLSDNIHLNAQGTLQLGYDAFASIFNKSFISA